MSGEPLGSSPAAAYNTSQVQQEERTTHTERLDTRPGDKKPEETLTPRAPDLRLEIDNRKQYVRPARDDREKLDPLGLSVGAGDPVTGDRHGAAQPGLTHGLIPRLRARGPKRANNLPKPTRVKVQGVAKVNPYLQVSNGNPGDCDTRGLTLSPFNAANIPIGIKYSHQNSKLLQQSKLSPRGELRRKSGVTTPTDPLSYVTRNNTLLLPKLAIAEEFEVHELLKQARHKELLEKSGVASLPNPAEQPNEKTSVSKTITAGKLPTKKSTHAKVKFSADVDDRPESDLFLTEPSVKAAEIGVFYEEDSFLDFTEVPEGISTSASYKPDLSREIRRRNWQHQRRPGVSDIKPFRSRGMAKMPTRLSTVSVGNDVPASTGYRNYQANKFALMEWSKYKQREEKQPKNNKKGTPRRKQKQQQYSQNQPASNAGWHGEEGEGRMDTRWQSATTIKSYTDRSQAGSEAAGSVVTAPELGEAGEEGGGGGGAPGVYMAVATISINEPSPEEQERIRRYNFSAFRHSRVRRQGKRGPDTIGEEHAGLESMASYRTPQHYNPTQHYEYQVVAEANRAPQVSQGSPRVSRTQGGQRPKPGSKKSLSYESYERAFLKDEDERNKRYNRYTPRGSSNKGQVNLKLARSSSQISHERVYEYDLPPERSSYRGPQKILGSVKPLAPLSRQSSSGWSSTEANPRHSSHSLSRQPKYASVPNLSAPTAEDPRSWPIHNHQTQAPPSSADDPRTWPVNTHPAPPPTAEDPRTWPLAPQTPFVPHNPPPSAASWHRETTSSGVYSPDRYVNPATPFRRFQEIDSFM